MTTQQITRRIAALEREVAQLKDQIERGQQPSRPWWEQIAGSFAGDPAFKQAMKLGKQYRQSLGKRKARGK